MYRVGGLRGTLGGVRGILPALTEPLHGAPVFPEAAMPGEPRSDRQMRRSKIGPFTTRLISAIRL